MEHGPFMDESLIEHCDFPYVPWPTHDIYIYGLWPSQHLEFKPHALIDSCGLVTISQGPANPTHGKWLRHLAPFLRGGIPCKW